MHDAVFRFFHETLRCRRDVAGLLASLVTYQGRLPTGSSSSPIISYYAYKPMFDELHQLAAEYDLSMTCYVDDVTMSGARATRKIQFEAHKIIGRYGLKSHKMKKFSPNEPRIVTGVCITPGGDRVPNRLHLKIKQGVDKLVSAPSLLLQDQARRSLIGRVEAAGQIEPKFRTWAREIRRDVSHDHGGRAANMAPEHK